MAAPQLTGAPLHRAEGWMMRRGPGRHRRRQRRKARPSAHGSGGPARLMCKTKGAAADISRPETAAAGASGRTRRILTIRRRGVSGEGPQGVGGR